ncbi:Uncharacterised protein [Candidatus Tiddalikarchaeum anstoanum]|nr:Uncharacterised protein [Candidatus Tiddalikarchaeum anstoanum]
MKKETQLVYDSLFSIEDIRQLLRDTVPEHKLSKEQKELLKKKVELIKKDCDELVKLL